MSHQVGISGLAVYVPPHRINLSDWCQWYGQPWDKIRAVVGHSFRMRGPRENVYTMAAISIVRLIEQYDVDPAKIRYLALGTESSTDNAAGSVVVKGLVNRYLEAQGKPPIGRACEVPEFKHACLGGVYGMKNAVRFLQCEPEDAVAIVVSADVAEYSRGTSGEPTQGAGAVAMLLEKQAKMLILRPEFAGSSSAYRQVDFRKPLARIMGEKQRQHGQLRDFPVFNGRYSTTCYLDATLNAVRDMFNRRIGHPIGYLEGLGATFMHRPYRKMPEDGFGMTWLMALATGSFEDRQQFARLAEKAGVDADMAISELSDLPDLDALVSRRDLDANPFSQAGKMLKVLKSEHGDGYTRSLRLGSELMMNIGNLYTAALPAWIAAGFDEALEDHEAFGSSSVLLIGYGSGDASEAIPAQVVVHWREAAKKIRFDDALAGAMDLGQADYESLHDRGELTGDSGTRTLFELDHVGTAKTGPFQDFGVEYYAMHEDAERARATG